MTDRQGVSLGIRQFIRMSLDPFFDRLAGHIARRVVHEYFFHEFHPHTQLARRASRETVRYVEEHMPAALYFMTRYDLLHYAMQRVNIDGSILEFGVASGKSIRAIAATTDRTVHGFDTFEGLPEDWTGTRDTRGTYGQGGKLPQVPSNVTLHKGLFEDILPEFLARDTADAAFVHVDCDLYTSTRTVLEHLAPRIRPGTVLVFDEYFNYPQWRAHEFMAFQEFVEREGIEYEYVAYARHQVALIVVRA